LLTWDASSVMLAWLSSDVLINQLSK
jgi:hypothetical protein